MKFYDFIEYTNEEQLLVYKHPCEDFNTSTKLIVREGQLAIFLKNGEICDIFEPGRYKLSTENIPILRKLMSLPTGGETTFSAEVFFISTTNIMSLKWGTSSSMDLQDPTYKVIVKVGACGEASFRIIDAPLFFRNLVGTRGRIEQKDLMIFFRSLINMHIKNVISNALTIDKISILEINSNLVAFANNVLIDMNGKIAQNGVTLTYFTIENVMIPENDPSVLKLKESLSKRADMDIIGYSYREKRSFDVMDNIASNSGGAGANLTGTIIGAGIGLGVAGSVAQTVKDISKPLAETVNPTFVTPNTDGTQNKTCPKCNAVLPVKVKFCFECGYGFPQKRYCMSCGVELPQNAKFCLECGEKVQ